MTIDEHSPYQPPGSFDRPAAESDRPARPIMAFLLTTFGVGAILVVLMILVEMLSPPIPPLMHLAFLFVPYIAWVCVPGLAAGVIASRISRRVATGPELPVVAVLLFLPVGIPVVASSMGRPAGFDVSMVMFVVAWFFQFWVAGRLGRRFQGTGQ